MEGEGKRFAGPMSNCFLRLRHCVLQVHNPTALLIDRAITPVWYVVGIIGNTLAACVWLQRRVWSGNSSAVYLATISIADLIFLLLHILQVDAIRNSPAQQ